RIQEIKRVDHVVSLARARGIDTQTGRCPDRYGAGEETARGQVEHAEDELTRHVGPARPGGGLGRVAQVRLDRRHRAKRTADVRVVLNRLAGLLDLGLPLVGVTEE